MTEVSRIIDLMDRSFAGPAWHGPPLQALLTDVTAEAAATHAISGGHSIWELVNHISARYDIVRQRLLGQAVDPSPEVDWPPVPEVSEAAWQRTIDRLVSHRARLRHAVEGLSDEALNRHLPRPDCSIYVTLHGSVQHDLYHAGQIALLKKALG